MEIALVLPNHHSHIFAPPLGIGYLSSYLQAHGHSTRLIDAHNLDLSHEEVVRRCAESSLVGISCHSAFILPVAALSRKLKEAGHAVVIGGPHPSALPRETIEMTGADYVVAGEGEQALCHIAEHHEKGEVFPPFQGVIRPGDETLSFAPLFENLDNLPFPDWKAIDPRFYRRGPHGGVIKYFPVAPVTTTRGCCFGCKFCASPALWGRKVRFRSPESVVEEIELLVKDFQVREIHFEDDNITLKREHMEEIARLLIRRKLSIVWACPNGVRVESVDRELLRLMRQSGCYMLAFGIESGNQAILDRIGKQIDLSTAEKAVRMAHREGILTQGCFVFGFPGESLDTIRRTVALARRLPLDRAQFALLDILPGSELWSEIRNQGNWEPDWHYKSFHESPWTPEGLTKEQLKKMRAWAFKSFYLRPKQILYLLGNIKIEQIPYILSRLRDCAVLPDMKLPVPFRRRSP